MIVSRFRYEHGHLLVRELTTPYDLSEVPLDEQAETVLRPALDDFTRVNSEFSGANPPKVSLMKIRINTKRIGIQNFGF